MSAVVSMSRIAVGFFGLVDLELARDFADLAGFAAFAFVFALAFFDPFADGFDFDFDLAAGIERS